MKTYFILFWFWASCLQILTHNCVFHQYAGSNHYKSRKAQAHQLLKPNHNKQQQSHSHGRLLYGAGRPAMRISLNTDDFNSIKTTANGQAQTTTQNLNFVLKAMKVAQVFFQSRLKVSSEASVDVPASCYDFNPPSTDVSNGIAATDLHIYVRYITDSTRGYGATGISCQWNLITSYPDTTLKAGRPTVGRIIFNTYNIVDRKSSLTNRLFASITATALHETTHILGFDQSLYGTYLDYNTGNLYSQVTQSQVLNAARTGGANHMMLTPAVKAWAQQHYGCSGILGMPLQNQEGTGVRGSHWERLTAYDELMTGTEIGPQKAFTALTFALFKDMGWYGVDDTFNDTTNYGKNKGCSFFNDACYSSTTFPKYFCNPSTYSGITQCSSTFTGKAICSNTAGLMADGCGLFGQYFHCVDPDSIADFYQSYTLQSYGTGSLCAKGTISTAGISTNQRSRCYPFVCDFTTLTITFTIGPYTLYCFNNEQGQNKTVTGMQGSLECPIFDDFCSQSRKFCPNWCSKNGYCTRGVCNCYSNATITYSGVDCSITSCTTANTYYYAPSSSCLPTCPSGYYANKQSKTCLPCDSSCSECRDEPQICTSCISTPSNPQYFDQSTSTCVSSCPSNTFLQVDTCILCDSTTAGCATCSGSSSHCTSCVNSAHFLNELGNCGTTCSGSYNKYDMINKVCRQTCPNTLYLSGSSCIKCTPNYKIVDVLDNNCYPSCPAGYYTDNTNSVCGRCNETCKQCYDQYSQNCTSCWQNSTLKYHHLDMCLTGCPDGFYTEVTLGKCELCDVSLYCATCQLVSASVKCITCKYGYYLQINKTCTTGCDPTFYKNQWNHSCDSCSTQCRDCNGPYQSSCLNCVSPKYFLRNSTGGYCLSVCPTQGYVTFLSTTCLPCHKTCQTCINQTSAGCSTCVNGLYLESNKCRYVCSPGKYADTTSMSCLTCNVSCTFCFGPTVDNCTECQPNLVLNNFTCTASCPEGFTANSFKVCDKTAWELIKGVALLSICMLLIIGI